MTWPNSDPDHLIVSSAEMTALEEKIISQGMPVEALMEKVGQKMKDWIFKRPDLLKEGVLVLVGPGHNGGDGLVLARELYLEGIQVEIWCPFKIKKQLTRHHFEYCNWLGIKTIDKVPDASSKSIWIEALVGLGQSRPLPSEICKLFKAREKANSRRLIALDVPAGISSDTGEIISDFAATASYTLTVGLFKQGLLQDVALPYVGSLVRIDIGIAPKVFNHKPELNQYRLTSNDLTSAPLPEPSKEKNKYQRGRVLVLAGSNEYRGAALLALKGALASGVGSVNAFVPKVIGDSLWEVAPEVVVSGIIEDSKYADMNLGQYLNRIDSFLVGPGLGKLQDKWTSFSKSLEDFRGLLVLDADALNGLAFSSEGWQWILKRKGPTWITPHSKEFDRLFPNLKDLSPLEAVSKAAKITRAAVLLKGAHSLIASPSGRVWQLGITSSEVARTGLGDVLAGFVAGLGAIGFSLENQDVNCELLALAALIHSEGGRRCRLGSKATLVSASIAKLVRTIQEHKCVQRDI